MAASGSSSRKRRSTSCSTTVRALPRAGWQVVESDGQRLRAEREGMAFEVAMCDVDGKGGAVGVVWAGTVTDQSEARCDRI